MNADTRARVAPPTLVPGAAAFLLLMLAYWAVAGAGLHWSTVSGAASPVFPAAGVALAGLLLGGLRLWPAIFLGRLLCAFTDGIDQSWIVMLGIAGGNALAALAAAAGTLRVLRGPPDVTRLRDLLWLIGLGAGGSALVAASLGTLMLLTAEAIDGLGVPLTWINWWSGDFTGSLLVAPLALAWTRGAPLSERPCARIGFLLCIACCSLLAWGVFATPYSLLLRSWVLFPALTWAALAFRVRGAATALLPVAGIALWGTSHDMGPLADAGAFRFLLLQQFIAGACISTLVMAVVADERRAREALSRTERRLELVLEAGDLGFWDWNVVDGTVVYGGRWAALLGWEPGDVSPDVRGWEALMHPDERQGIRQALEDHLRGDTPFFECEHRLRCRDGSWRWMLGRGRVVERDAEGRALRMLGTHADISARKAVEAERASLHEAERRARAEAERANLVKDEFLSTVSHELRTPLNAILGWAQVLMRRASDPAAVAEGVAVIDRNARAQARLIEDLLDMSRITAGKVRLDARAVSLRDVVIAAVETVRPQAAAKGLQLRVDTDSVPSVSGDPDRLQQVVWNLLSNAIKFTPQGGTVRVRLSATADRARIEVIDDGMGIAPAFLPHVFERFRQHDGTTTRRHGGLGLGLSIVQQLVQMHGGTVRADSEGEGRGARFTVELPMQPPGAAEPAGAPGAGTTPLPSLQGRRLLVVDDEPDVREVVRRVLAEAGALVMQAPSSTAALALVETAEPELLLSDIGMPGMDGLELIRRLRAQEALRTDGRPPLPAIALSAYARKEDRQRALEAGYDDYLLKPVDAATLVRAVAARLRDASPRP